MARFTPPRDPGKPLGHSRPALAVIGWLLRAQRKLVLVNTIVTCVFLGCQQFIPYVVGRAVDDGLVADDRAALYWWSGALAVLIGLTTLTGVISFIYMMYAFMDTEFRVQRRLVDAVVAVGAPLKQRADAGELVSVSASDATSLSFLSMMTGRLISSVFAFALALAILATQSWWFVLAVGLGLPAMFMILRPLFLLLESRGGVRRQRFGEQTGIGVDAVAGLRVLRGIGGEAHFTGRYRAASQKTRLAGVRVGTAAAWLEFTRLALPGALLLVILWLGARMTLDGVISVGQFVALFGYLVALARPLGFAIMSVDALTGAIVAARRVHGIPEEDGPVASGMRGWPSEATLHDPGTGVTAEAGLVTGVAVKDGMGADDLLDRLGGHGDATPATIGGIPLSEFDTAIVRSRIHLLDTHAQLFSGPLREQLDVDGEQTDADIMRAVHTASAVDIVGVDLSLVESDEVPDSGYDLETLVGERGRNFSGGERQRLLLARALLAAPEILLLDDPTSACDAQTEARIAERLVRHRRGRTTVIATNSPQLLAVCDRVQFVADGVAAGTHAELLRQAEYREAVTR
ncbi:ABC transporter ATP-binding protein/permease [Glycomyces sp. L485]|uniref:ABC transporter transmembrane domain-containing protein n=1 Tax=Glycomyces sp. L485 TaxID=2909235 RepID=UPI001F4BA808|nr:ABC transporter ATP-binding protein [Glycomyces sp. L485]MCH7232288.1 ABC transporter ATP-binding protein/permease [Glycomyces sp. L485]